MRVVTMQTSYYEYEQVSTVIDTEFGRDYEDRYCKLGDTKYLDFLKKHGFRNTARIFDLYLRLCAAGIL